MSTLSFLQTFYKDFFRITNCDILSEENNSITVQLTKEIDKAIMHRPFYWTYMETMQQEGIPQKVSFTTNDNTVNDYTHQYDTPLYNRTMSWLQKSTVYGVYYESIHTNVETMLYPWLLINVKICYGGKIHTEEIISIGLQLIHGIIEFQMMEKLEEKSLQEKMNDYCYTIAPIISVLNGYKRMDEAINQHLESKSYEWTMTSYREMKLEEKMYEKHDTNMHKNEKSAMYKRLQPKIHVEVLQGALIYIRNNQFRTT